MQAVDAGVHWVRAWPNDDAFEFRIGRLGDKLVAEWPGLAVLRTDRSGKHPEFRWIDEPVDPVVAERFRRGRLHALLRHLRGELTFHAAAVSLRGVAVMFLGASNAGKSS